MNGLLRQLERFIKEFGMKGIKVHGATGFYPNDRICYPIYELAAELGVPVIFHTGEILKPFYFKHTQPIHLQEVAMDFPGVPMVFAHAGLSFQNEAAAICYNATNVYLDVSLWQPKLLRPLEFYRELRSLLNRVPWQRMLFGSDFPAIKGLVSQEKWIKAFTEIPESVKAAGIEFPKEVIEALLGGNAAKLLKLGQQRVSVFFFISRLLKNSIFAGCSKMPRCKAPEILRVASRRIRSDFLPRRRVGESARGVLGRTPQ